MDEGEQAGMPDEEATAPPAGFAAWREVVGAETAVGSANGVRSSRQLQPVPMLRRAVVEDLGRSAAPSRPVYDPFSARRRPAPQWLVRYTAGLVAGDVTAVVVSGAAALAAGLGGSATAVAPAVLWFVAFTASWPLVIALLGGYAERRLGTGSDEYRRVVVAGLLVVAGAGVLSLGLDIPVLEPIVLVGAPLATGTTVVSRSLLRRRLHAARNRGQMTKQVVVVGREVGVVDLVRRLRRDTTAGLTVVGACIPQPQHAHLLSRAGIRLLGGLDDAVTALEEVRADAVLVASASETAGQYLRDLSWRLEGTNIEVLLAPGLVEAAPARLQVRPTVSIPLIQVREPEFRGLRRLVKGAFDRVFAALLLAVGAPVFLALALAIVCTSRGPVFYRHRRIGMRGAEFDLLKFRSMTVDADKEVDGLMAINEGNDVQFKLRRDPRVTRVGRLLRRSSLDELPQLINVLKGDMSIVGPRPHVAREVELYGPDMHRRLLVKPGITGLWQVSGRSDLTWDESVELDVRYVDNWSLGLDFHILQRTLGAVVRASGAY